MSGKGTVQRAVSDCVRCIQKISKVQVGWTKPMQNWPMQSRLGWRAACIIWWQAVLSHQIGGGLFSDSCECVSQWQWSNEGFVERSHSAVQFLVPCARLRTSKKDQKSCFLFYLNSCRGGSSCSCWACGGVLKDPAEWQVCNYIAYFWWSFTWTGVFCCVWSMDVLARSCHIWKRRGKQERLQMDGLQPLPQARKARAWAY